MALQGGTKEYNTFVAGLITEASPLTHPENSTSDEANFELGRDGSRKRRLGMDFEPLYTLIDTEYLGAAIEAGTLSTYRWDSAGNNVFRSFAVCKIHEKLWFLDLNSSSASSNIKGSGPLDVSGVGNDPLQFETISGVLVCVNKNVYPFYIEYNTLTDTFTKSTITVKTRDFWGVDDTLEVDERPSTLSSQHRYNLYNQGWTVEAIADMKATSDKTYPSNADVISLGKDSSDAFSAALLKKQLFGTGPAPKGKYIIDVFDRGTSRTAESGVSLATENEAGRFSTLAVFAGRMCYAGILSNVKNGDSHSPNLTGAIFFTKVINSATDLGACYQEADPSSEHITDIIDSDGGFIIIPEAKQIFSLKTTENSLVVVADNGVWEVYGDAGGFTATAYQVSKVSNVGSSNPGAVINYENSILLWSDGGIYNLTVDPTSGRLQATNLSESSIQTLYNNIPDTSKESAVGCFDPANRKVSWLYNDTEEYNGYSHRNRYNKELVLDLVLKAFYVREIKNLSSQSPYIAGCVVTPGYVSLAVTQDVVVNGVAVEVGGDQVQTPIFEKVRGDSTTKYLVVKPTAVDNYCFTLGAYNNTSFLDWESMDSTGVDAAGYMETGEELFGSTQHKKQVPYITFHFNRTETGFTEVGDDLIPVNPSGCLVQSKWDFSNHANSGKYGSQFQAYRLSRRYQPQNVSDTFDYGQTVISTKSKLRGKGRALRMRISTEPGKDLQLLGWGTNLTRQTVV